MASRRTPSGPRSRRPHRPGARPRPPSAAQLGDTTSSIPVVEVAVPPRGLRHRVTGRMVVLVLVVTMLAMSFGSSLKASVQQRSQIQALKSQIAERRAAIDALEEEKARWEDPSFVEQQARSRFGYVMPGEESYVVLGADGRPLAGDAELADPDEVVKTVPTTWWENAWGSVRLAGQPPKAVPQEQTVPADRIEAPDGDAP